MYLHSIDNFLLLIVESIKSDCCCCSDSCSRRTSRNEFTICRCSSLVTVGIQSNQTQRMSYFILNINSNLQEFVVDHQIFVYQLQRVKELELLREIKLNMLNVVEYYF